MPNFYEMFETPKIHWPITFVVDTSGSMAGQRLVQLNSALHELSNILESLAYQGDIQLSIRLIEFNTTARWVLGDASTWILIRSIDSSMYPTRFRSFRTSLNECVPSKITV